MKAIVVIIALILVAVIAYKAIQKYRRRDISNERRNSGPARAGDVYFDPESTLAGAPPESADYDALPADEAETRVEEQDREA